MAISDKDFYAAHGFDMDLEKIQSEYVAAKYIELLRILQREIDALPNILVKDEKDGLYDLFVSESLVFKIIYKYRSDLRSVKDE